MLQVISISGSQILALDRATGTTTTLILVVDKEGTLKAFPEDVAEALLQKQEHTQK